MPIDLMTAADVAKGLAGPVGGGFQAQPQEATILVTPVHVNGITILITPPAGRQPTAMITPIPEIRNDPLITPIPDFQLPWVMANQAHGSNQTVPDSLQAHEAAGGHLIAKHVEKTNAELLARFQKEPYISGSSTFPDAATAEQAVADALSANQGTIGAFLAGSDRRMIVEHDVGTVVGRFIPKGGISALPVARVRLVIDRDPSLPGGLSDSNGVSDPMILYFPKLRNFIGAYFNQDWDMDGDSDEAIVEFYKNRDPPETVARVLEEMSVVISSYESSDIDRMLEEYGCYYYYLHSGYNGKTWLIRLRDFMAR
jgi:hypothetical protein